MKSLSILSLSGGTALVLALAAACSGGPQQRETATYRTVICDTATRVLPLRYTAVLKGRQTVEIRPQVSGTITQILIREGERVRKGQELFVIDPVPYVAALRTAQANVESARTKLATAELELESIKQLFEEQIVSEYDLKKSENTVAEAEATLSQARAQELSASNNLSYTRVKSPSDGQTGMIPYRVGALVGSTIAEPLVTVSDDSEVHAYFSMTENQILELAARYGSMEGALRQMPRPALLLSNGQEYGASGQVDAVSGTVDAATGTVSVRASFPNEGHLLRDGGSATVLLPVRSSGVIVIPKSATFELQDRVYAYKVVDGKAVSFRIRVSPLDNGTEYLVEEGLERGDEIIAEGAGLVREGTAVRRAAQDEKQ